MSDHEYIPAAKEAGPPSEAMAKLAQLLEMCDDEWIGLPEWDDTLLDLQDTIRALEAENARLKEEVEEARNYGLNEAASAKIAEARVKELEELLKRTLAVHGCSVGSPHFPACAEAVAALRGKP